MSKTEITCKNNGPLLVKGEFVIKDIEGNEFDLAGRDIVAMCRCGQSNTKPFCDGSHKTAEFNSVVKAFSLRS